MREIKFRCWNAFSNTMHSWGEMVNLNKIHLLDKQKDNYPVMQYTGLKDKNGVEVYEGDLINIFYKSKIDDWFFDGIYRVSIRPTGVNFQFVKLLWESGGYNQLPYESMELKDYGFVRSDYKNENGDFRLCIADSDKWYYSNYFEVIGNIFNGENKNDC